MRYVENVSFVVIKITSSHLLSYRWAGSASVGVWPGWMPCCTFSRTDCTDAAAAAAAPAAAAALAVVVDALPAACIVHASADAAAAADVTRLVEGV